MQEKYLDVRYQDTLRLPSENSVRWWSRFGDESTSLDNEKLIQILDMMDNSLRELGTILAGRAFDKKNGKVYQGAVDMSINVSKSIFKQKGGLEAGSTSTWGWCFAFTQEEDYHPESRELIQAIEQYGKVRVGNRVYTPGGAGMGTY